MVGYFRRMLIISFWTVHVGYIFESSGRFFVAILFYFERPIDHLKAFLLSKAQNFFLGQVVELTGTHRVFCCLNQSWHYLRNVLVCFSIDHFGTVSNNSILDTFVAFYI